MIVELTHRIDVRSVQQATALREAVTEMLKAEDCEIIETRHTKVLDSYRVIGVDTVQRTPFIEVVEAEDQEKAKAAAIGSSKTKVVAEVRKDND